MSESARISTRHRIMTPRLFALHCTLVSVLVIQIDSANAQDISAVKEWSGTVAISDSGTVSSNAQNGTRSTSGKLHVERNCSGTVHLTDRDHGYWSGEAQLSCSINDAFEHKVDNSNPRQEVHNVNTVLKQGAANVLVNAELNIDLDRKTYSFDVAIPSVETTESQSFSNGYTSSSSSSASSEYVFDVSQSLVEDQPLSGSDTSGSDTSISGSINVPAAYFLPVGSEPSGSIQRAITWSLSPGRP